MPVGSLHFIPGTACDQRLWARVQPLLRGYDASYGSYSDAMSLEEMIAHVAANIPLGCHLIGFSLGGYLAAEAVIRHHKRVKSLTLIATSLMGLSEEEKSLRRANAQTVLGSNYKGMSRRRLGQFVHPNHASDPSITDIVKAMEQDTGQERLKNQLLATIDRRDLRKLLPQINVPIHLIGSNDDAICKIDPMKSVDAAEIIRFTEVGAEGATTGHMIPLEAPTTLAAVMTGFFFDID